MGGGGYVLRVGLRSLCVTHGQDSSPVPSIPGDGPRERKRVGRGTLREKGSVGGLEEMEEPWCPRQGKGGERGALGAERTLCVRPAGDGLGRKTRRCAVAEGPRERAERGRRYPESADVPWTFHRRSMDIPWTSEGAESRHPTGGWGLTAVSAEARAESPVRAGTTGAYRSPLERERQADGGLERREVGGRKGLERKAGERKAGEHERRSGSEGAGAKERARTKGGIWYFWWCICEKQ